MATDGADLEVVAAGMNVVEEDGGQAGTMSEPAVLGRVRGDRGLAGPLGPWRHVQDGRTLLDWRRVYLVAV